MATKEEILDCLRTANALASYGQIAKAEFVDFRIQRLEKLPEDQRIIYDKLLRPHLENVAEAIDSNSQFCQFISDVGNNWAESWGATPELRSDPSAIPQLPYQERLYSTLRQVAREWSAEGAAEREQCFGPILEELKERFDDPENVKVFVPGCGLGRLPFEIALLGFDTTGNEYTMPMLFTSCFILNYCTESNMVEIYPFAHTFSGNRETQHQLLPVRFPDVPPTLLLDRKGQLSNASGDFIQSAYECEKQDVIVTCFFLDATPNIMETIASITHLIKEGGVWINFGPLHWHYEHVRGDETDDDIGGLELDYASVYELISTYGWTVEKSSQHKATYCSNPYQMLQHVYDCEFFVAVKNDATPEELLDGEETVHI